MRTNEKLEAKLKAINTLTATTTGIFVVIILAWVILGYWKTNILVFISTLCFAVASSSSQVAILRSIRAEIEKRQKSATDAGKSNEREPE